MPEVPSPNDSDSSVKSAIEKRAQPPKWFVLAGCAVGGCVVVPIVAVGLGMAGLGGAVWNLVRSTGSYQVYQLAAAEVETNAIAAELLGNPVEPGWVSQTQEHYDNSSGQVCLRFDVFGADNSGSTYVEAQKVESAWQLHQLLLTVNREAALVKLVPLSPDAKSLCPDFDNPEPETTEPDTTQVNHQWLHDDFALDNQQSN